MLTAMRRELPSIYVRAVAVPWLGLSLLGCRLAPTEAAAPDASAWSPDHEDLGLEDEEAPPASARVDAPEEGEPAAARYPRPARAIFREELQRATGPGPAYLLRQLAPEPYRHDGHFIGWEITQVFPDDPELCAPGCDLALGDVILGVNGHRLHTPQDLSDALEALPSWTHLRVQRLREGKRIDVTYAVLDAPG